MIPPLLPILAAEWALSPVQVGLINTIYAVGRLAGSYPTTRFRARQGTRLAVLVGFGGLVVGAIGCGGAPTFPIFLAGRLVMGVGASAAFLAVFAEVLEAAPAAWRGRAANAFEATAILSLAVGGVLAASLTGVGGWRGVFLGMAALLVASLPVVRRIGPGAGRHAGSMPGDPGSLPASARWPLVPVHVAGLTLALTWSGLFATLVPLLGHERYGLAGAALGWALAAGYVAELVGLIVLGLVIDRVRREPVFLAGALSVLAGGVLLAVAARPAAFVVALALVGGGYANWMIPATVLADRTGTPIPPGQLAVFRITMDTGMILGPLLLGSVAELVGDRVAVATAGLVLVAGALALWRR
jgi:MFS family permease